MVLSYRTVKYVYTSNLSSLGEVVGSEVHKELSQFMIVTHCWQGDRLKGDGEGEGKGARERELEREREGEGGRGRENKMS